MPDYFRKIWGVRYFWWHLSMSDLRARFRRSFFGILWAIIQPLGLTLLISAVFSRLMNQNIADYAPYILSGIIIWDYFTIAAVTGSMAFVQADAYIKQTRHPLAIYTLRNTLTGIVIFAFASISLFVWILFAFPGNVNWSWLAVPTIVPMMAIIAWPMATILAYIGVRFRDLPNALTLVLQAAWFVSPVYFRDTMFRNGGLDALIDYNPVYHVMQIIRAPMLHGEWPTLGNYIWCMATAVVLFAIAALMGKRLEKKVIFYL